MKRILISLLIGHGIVAYLFLVSGAVFERGAPLFWAALAGLVLSIFVIGLGIWDEVS